MTSQASNPRILSEIASLGGWFRHRVIPTGLSLALALTFSSAFGQESSSASKKAAANDDFDSALEAFTSPDETLASTAPQAQRPPPPALGAGFLGSPGFFPASRVGFLNLGGSYPLIPVVGRGAGELPFSNGIPIAAISPSGVPLGGPGLLGGSDSLSRADDFDVMKQPPTWKYTGSQIDLLYGFSSNGASVRATGFVTSMASDTTQIVVGASFSDQSGLTFPGGRYSPYGNSKFSAQTQQYFAAINYKLFGGAMIIGVDFAVADTKLNGNFQPIARANQSRLAVVNPNNLGSVKGYSTQVGLSGQLPANLSYEVGLGIDQNRLSGGDGVDLRSLMLPRRR
jgi:hypothetical protein